MKRRKAIRNLVLFSLGTGVIYSCKDKYEAIKKLNLQHLVVDNTHLDILDDLSKMIVPFHSIPELSQHTALPFIMNMVDNVYEEKDREIFAKGYAGFDQEILTLKGKEYSKMEEAEKQSLLSEMNEELLIASPELYAVFKTVKSKSIQYFTTSEYYQRKVNYYQMAPGKFKGDVLLTRLKNKNDE